MYNVWRLHVLIYLYMEIPCICTKHVLYVPVPRRRCVHIALKGTDTHPAVDAVRVHQPPDHCALKTGLPLPEIQSAWGSEPAGELGIPRSWETGEKMGQWNERAGL